MNFILGLIVMIVLTAISSLPIFIVFKFKNSYNGVIAWILFFFCSFIYILLKIVCIEFGVLNESKSMPIPVLAMLVFYFLSRLGVVETEDTQKKFNSADKSSNKTGSIIEHFLSVLEEYKKQLNNYCFNEFVYKDIAASYEKYKKEYEHNLAFKNNDGGANYEAIKQSVVSLLASYTGNLLESGKYHIYRGVLDNTGKELLKMYDFFMNEMLSLDMFDENTKKKIDEEWIKKDRRTLLENIKMAG